MYRIHQTHGQLRFSKSCPSVASLRELFRVTNLLALLLALGGCESRNSLSRIGLELEARVGIGHLQPENRPENGTFAAQIKPPLLPLRHSLAVLRR